MAKIADIPQTVHWAIIRTVSVHIPGDERSRTNPGHGYPASTESYFEYTTFSDEGAWKKEIAALEKSRKPYRAIEARPAVVSLTVNVAVEVSHDQR